MELAIGEIAQVVGQSQPRVSRHVRILVEAGLAERRKEGSWVFLRLARVRQISALLAFMDVVPAQSSDEDGEGLWLKADLARLAAVREDRARAAAHYFSVHADQWDAIRSLHVADASVESAMRDMLGDGPIGRLLDIGTGTGRMVQLFGPAADEIVAVDRSPDMLRLARAKLPAEAEKYALVVGDFYALPLADSNADTVILHQVLHFADAPEAVIAEAARVLGMGGRLLIADFAPHEHEELRLRDQHARLGFSDAQIGEWFAAAGIALEAVRDLEGGDLTVKLWLGRRQQGGATVLPMESLRRNQS